MNIVITVGARPNFIKIAPLIKSIEQYNAYSMSGLIKTSLVHTGQHYDFNMSRVFFNDLTIPEPDKYLNVHSGTHAEQTGKIMMRFEKLLLEEKPDLVIVVGDVNSTLATALSAIKLHIPLAHIEAGLRSFDRTMPEELNRVLTDVISDYLFTPTINAGDNLTAEGIPEARIFYVGNIMVDSLLSNIAKAEQSQVLSHFNIVKGNYALVTLHRPANVDMGARLLEIVSGLEEISKNIQVVFPVHPRTRAKIIEFGIDRLSDNQNMLMIQPVGYLDFLNMEMNAKFVVTDSGGIQVETTVLNIPCLTLRDTTEWPITVSQGTNMLLTGGSHVITKAAWKILECNGEKGVCPELWDGKTSGRIVEILAEM